MLSFVRYQGPIPAAVSWLSQSQGQSVVVNPKPLSYPQLPLSPLPYLWLSPSFELIKQNQFRGLSLKLVRLFSKQVSASVVPSGYCQRYSQRTPAAFLA